MISVPTSLMDSKLTSEQLPVVESTVAACGEHQNYREMDRPERCCQIYCSDCGAAVCRSVLAQAIFDDLLKCYGRHLDVRVESASVGPAPPGEDSLVKCITAVSSSEANVSLVAILSLLLVQKTEEKFYRQEIRSK